jgi:hypothetical protein
LGTTGSGRFEDYRPGQDSGRSSSGGQEGQGRGATDRCQEELLVSLEDVARSSYYSSVSRVPGLGEGVTLAPPLEQGRLAVRTAAGEIIGYLPTRLNYVASECFPRGITYDGEVTDSALAPVPSVGVRLRPRA